MQRADDEYVPHTGQVVENVDDLLRVYGVKRTRGLVQQKDLGLDDDLHADSDAANLSARQAFCTVGHA